MCSSDLERIKTVYGSVMQMPSDAREMLKVPVVGEEDEANAQEVPKSMLVQIIQPRLEETFELVRGQLEASGFGKMAGRRVVLTGGASQLEGVRDLAEMVLDRQVRLGRPKAIRGLPESVSGPAFATCGGLLRYGLREHVARPDHRWHRLRGGVGSRDNRGVPRRGRAPAPHWSGPAETARRARRDYRHAHAK